MRRVFTHPIFAAFVLLVAVVMAFSMAARASYPTGQQQQQPPSQGRAPDTSMEAVRFSVSPPLRDVQRIVPRFDPTLTFPEHEIETGPAIEGFVDEAVQKLTGPLAIPTPNVNFEGMYNIWGGYPPDTAGDVGLNHYIQIVNVGFQIFSKTGTSLYGPANNNTLFIGAGGFCESTNRGDPIALYDEMADRYLVSWFAFTSQSGPTYQCIAVTAGPDPLGAWYRYEFLTGQTTFVDYPHLGVWPDAYYMAANLFGTPGGGGVYAFERERMLNGDPTARVVSFLGVASTLLPSDLDGPPPPVGAPNYFLRFSGSSNLALYKFHVDWATTGNSTFTGPTNLPVTAFSTGVGGIPQPGTAVGLANLADRLMYRLVYRNMGTHEALLANHTVDAGGSVAGVRWYELRDPNGSPTVFQQGTHTLGDGVERWMGSIGMDRMGNIAVGYSASSSTVFPSIRYAGRLSTDPLGQMAQGEASIIAGTGSQTGPGARWGDYSMMSVDPADGCTFWYTTEYIQVTGERTWRTRIASFKFNECVPVPPTPAATVTAPVPTVTPSATMVPACAVHTGSLAGGDLTQTSRIITVGMPPSTCAIPRSCPGEDTSVTTQHFYDQYTYANTTGASLCVTVQVIPGCSNNALTSVAYLGSYNPTSKCTNYIADGARGGPQNVYSFSLPAGQTAVIVVFEHNGGIGCENYTLNITSAQCAGTPAPTTTGTPPTAIVTVTSPPSTVTATRTSTAPVATNTSGPGVTNTATTQPVASNTPGSATATATACTLMFTDVPEGSTFYENIRCLACRGIINGYSTGCETGNPCFRPGNLVTRGQLAKIVSNAAGFDDPPGAQQFEDVPPGHTFYDFIGRLATRGIINGYPCGGPGEPCVLPDNLPYFRPNANVTRGQISKIVAEAAGLTQPPGAQQFEDVPPGHTFYDYIWRLTSLGIMNGYPCGGAGEPCNPPGNLPYFRPGANATRGQASKIVANTFFPECETPGASKLTR
ncbi:MAG: S-layer homology domain-containing protein [Chloroflexia bacterium]